MRTQRYRFQRRWELAFRSDKSWLTYGLSLVAIIFLLSGMMLGKAQPTEASGIVLTASNSEVDRGPWLTGYPLYVSQCARCHGVTGRGDGAGANSPTFSTQPRDLRAARFHFVSTDNGIASDDDLYRIIYQGLDNTGMPAFADLTNSQILSLIDVLNDFRAGGSEPGRTILVGDPPPSTEASVARGRSLFAEQCATCHGAAGHGDGEKQVFDYKDERIQPADLAAGKIKFSRKPRDIFTRITVGIPGGTGGGEVMTKFNRLPEADRWALVHYVMKEILPQ